MSLLAIVLILAVPVALLVVLLMYVFKTPTIMQTSSLAVGGLPESVYSLAWQEPFAYEAKVYASLSPDFASDPNLFVESAQLLWHIEPQPVGKKYPTLRSKVRVHIPSELRSSPSLHQVLYAHVFIQKAGQFSPHPNFSDPHLISSRIPLVQWNDITFKSKGFKIYLKSDKERKWELLGINRASWAIVLENNMYSSNNIPSYLQVTNGSSDTATYNPPLLPNTFTKGQPKGKPLATLKDKLLAVNVYQQAIDVELELSGIRQGWISAKAGIVDYLSSKKPVLVQKTILDPSNPEQNKTRPRVEWVKSDDLVVFGPAMHISVSLVFYTVVCIALICTLLPAFIRLLVRLLSTPATRWIGVSRATVSIMLSTQALATLGTIAKYGLFGIIGIILMPGLAITAFLAANLDDMAFAPWASLSQLVRKIFRRKASPDATRSLAAQQLALAVEGHAESDLAEASTKSNSYFRRPEPIIAIRRSVDKVAMRWIHLLSLPTIAIVALYILFLYEDRLLSWDFVTNVLTRSTHVFSFVTWLPQIIVNYRAKSGSLTPVMYNVLVLGSSVLLAILSYLTGHDNAIDGIMRIPTNVCHIIVIVQRIIYFKRVKQE
ncbi:hypothetical protein IW146_000288 [Coemansia sp. RSA 922]|nr:hypothetical protein H4S03_000289 [Coemansia sp. S3946]KAJ2117979.1 hypothetical protein IW146_000288 [Coemansia sp. RSA 922]